MSRPLETQDRDHAPPAIWRMIDANLNRSGEALRLLEDVLRLGFEDQRLAGRIKALRHRLADLERALDRQALVAARDVERDVGRTLQTPAEYERTSLADLLQANWHRAQQALRSLEESLKVVDLEQAKACEQLRYMSYDLERATALLSVHAAALEHARLCVLVDGGDSDSQFTQLARELIEAGVDLIQLRDKKLNDYELLGRGRRLSELVAGSRTRWIMNDRPDLAVCSGAAGVHLGQTDLPLPDAWRVLGVGKWIGISTHSTAEIEAAVDGGASYLGVGPVFASRTKAFSQLAGLELLSQVAALTALPAFAIGGIDESNIDKVLRAGARRVAVGSAVTRDAAPGKVVQRLLAKLA